VRIHSLVIRRFATFIAIGSTAAALLCADVRAAETATRVTYLANAGVMVERGDLKILFDPLFRNDYGRYRLLPPEMERALYAGTPPWDGIDAIFVSHYHGDHFSAPAIAAYLEAQPNVRLFAPAQAASALAELGVDDTVADRVQPVMLAYGDAPQSFELGRISAEVTRIPHSGWPDRMTDVENLAWRVSLGDATTVVHLGDADTRVEHYIRQRDYWAADLPVLALPPYWYFLSPNGRQVLDTWFLSAQAIGVHVPTDIPTEAANRPAELRGYELFTQPGETRVVAIGERVEGTAE